MENKNDKGNIQNGVKKINPLGPVDHHGPDNPGRARFFRRPKKIQPDARGVKPASRMKNAGKVARTP